jgi:NAD(P)-dependent dehydrogenase (short-subunit alcohol dehydrogenase family)
MNGKNIVVTGGSGGLGGAVIEALLERGAIVHVPAHEPDVPEHLRRDGIQVTPRVAMDDEAQVTAYYAALPPLWASVHLVGGFAMASIEKTALADFEKQWRMNTVTCFLACREAVKAMRRAGGGRIVNVAARPAITPTAGMLAYATAKAGVAAITQHLAAEVTGEGIYVNAVLPSIIDTPANRAAMPTADHAAWPKPAELAETIAFLASPENALTSGALVPVFGRA